MVVYAEDIEIGINGGHGLDTAGKRTPLLPAELRDKVAKKDGHMREWEFNHATSKYVEAALKRCGFRTLMISDTTYDTPLSTRTTLANNRKIDLYLSIHANANTSVWGDWGGIETFAYPNTKGWKIAEKVQAQLIEDTTLRNRGVKDGSHLWEIRKTSMPCILVECGFMDNLNEARLLLSDAYRRQVAESIVKGLCEYYGVKYRKDVTPTPTEGNRPSGDKAIGTLKVLVDDLWYYNKPDWDAKVGQVDKNTVLTVVDELTVNGSKMYKLISGTYITAYSGYVQFTKK